MNIDEYFSSGFTSEGGDITGNSGDCFNCSYPGKSKILNALRTDPEVRCQDDHLPCLEGYIRFEIDDFKCQRC
jgi:hypothetical protein